MSNQIRDDNTWRLLIIFASCEVADEWWHAISSGSIPILSENVRRITPQLYTHDPNKCNLYNFFTNGQFKSISDRFRGRMFLTLENDRGGRGLSIIPNLHPAPQRQPSTNQSTPSIPTGTNFSSSRIQLKMLKQASINAKNLLREVRFLLRNTRFLQIKFGLLENWSNFTRHRWNRWYHACSSRMEVQGGV